MKGGKREGAGRPPSTNPKSVIFKIRLTPQEHEKLLRVGGAVWVREALEKATDQVSDVVQGQPKDRKA